MYHKVVSASSQECLKLTLITMMISVYSDRLSIAELSLESPKPGCNFTKICSINLKYLRRFINGVQVSMFRSVGWLHTGQEFTAANITFNLVHLSTFIQIVFLD